jgi:hypothetical protein
VSEDRDDAFVRDAEVDDPGIVGARWWQKSLDDPMPRRRALTVLVLAGGAVAALGAVCAIGGAISASNDGPSFEWQQRRATDLQRTFGWDFGAVNEPLVFDGAVTQPFDRSALLSLANDLAPGDASYLPFAVTTLFEAPTAHATDVPAQDAASAGPLIDVLRPIHTTQMDVAYDRGVAFAKFAKTNGGAKAAVIVDLDGPQAVAFAAGASTAFDPVFLFDNWPHPRGVVASHKTLAAAVYYQPLFAKARANGAGRPPMFVLDRNRLAPYADDTAQFDNRYLARMPAPSAFAPLGMQEVWYVAPRSASVESDDLNDFLTSPNLTPTMMPVVRWVDVEWFEVTGASTGFFLYNPHPRSTWFSSGRAGGARPLPQAFGVVAIAVVLGTGKVLGAKLSRSGSFLRATSGGGG